MGASGQKHIHIIGICGTATSALAIAFHKKGWKVIGSDKGFYPPVSTHLSEAGVAYYAGWHPEKMGMPDIVMIGGSGKSSVNPEMLYAQEKNIPMYSYPEIIEKYFLRENNIVCAGTWGKTTTSFLLSYIFEQADLDPTYMTAGVSDSLKDSAKLSDGKWCILEGDEYTGSQVDNIAKFFHYHPTYLLLTSVSWDHADVYPTEELYFEAFRKLITEMPSQGMIVACADNEGVKKVIGNRKIISYGSIPSDYQYKDINHTKEGLSFTIKTKDAEYKIVSPLLGRFNAENMTGVFAMAHQAGIPAEKIISAIQSFKGIKRRLEKRYVGDVTVLDCHAPTAEKAASVLKSIRDVYKQKIIVVYEPNIGGRQRSSSNQYRGAFHDADLVIIPKLSRLKIDQTIAENDRPVEGDELQEIIWKYKVDDFQNFVYISSGNDKPVQYIDDDKRLIEFLSENAKKGDVIAFLGSHGFRGMIEEIITSLRRRSQ